MAGHVSWERTKALADAVGIKLVGRDGSVESAKEECRMCEPCMIAKASVLPRFASNHLPRAERVGEMLHCDTQGPWRVMSREGRRYKFTVMDDFSGYALDFYLRHKNEFISCIHKAIAFIERQTESKVKVVVCDQEFTAPREISEKYSDIIWKDAATADKDGNARAERINGVTGGPARALRQHARFPPNFWAEMEHTATVLYNILPITKGQHKGTSPYQLLFKRAPPLHQLRPIGCMGVMHVGKVNGKGSMPGKLVKLVGYDMHRNLYRVWDGQKVLSGVRNVRFDLSRVGESIEPQVAWEDATEGEIDPQPEFSDELDHSNTHGLLDAGIAVGTSQAVDIEPSSTDSPVAPFPHSPTTTPHVDREVEDKVEAKLETDHEPHEVDAVQGEQIDERMSIGPLPIDMNSPHAQHDPPTQYVEGKAPTKGVTWEQSDRITEANIVSGKRVRKQVDLHRTSTHHVTAMIDMDDCISHEEASEWMFYIHLPPDLAIEGMTLKDLQAGIDRELRSIAEFKTYQWVDESEARKAGVKIVGLTWVHKVKTDQDGLRFVKSRLSLRGDQLQPGISYNPEQLYVPCANHRSVLLLCKLTVGYGRRLFGVDFKNAYLNADMIDAIYARPPHGASMLGRVGKIWKVVKALYGAPQAGKRWYDIFSGLLKELGFVTLQSDPCMFMEKGVKIGDGIVGVFHVDDLIFMAPNRQAYDRFCEKLEMNFPIKRLGLAKEFKGMEIIQTKSEIILSQQSYARKVVKFYGYEHCKPSATPGSKTDPMPMDAQARLRQFSIPQIVGSLLFLAKMTRPDIEEALNSASVLQTVDVGKTYSKLGKIIRYLKNDRVLKFSKTELSAGGKAGPIGPMTVWPDAAHRVCLKTGKSRTGYVVLVGGDPVAWLSKRQSKVALSSNDAEIFAANEALREAMAIRNMRSELGIPEPKPFEVYEDNAQTILAAQRGLAGPRTKHLPLEEHYLHELEQEGIALFRKIGTKGQLGDVLTKYLPKDQADMLLDVFCPKLDLDALRKMALSDE